MDNKPASTYFPLGHGAGHWNGHICPDMPLTINIRQIREDRGYTLEDVADKVGVSIPHLSNVERGKKNLNNHLLTRIADALGVHPAALISDTFQSDRDRLGDILDQLAPDDRARVAAFAEALLQSQEASQRKV